MEGGGRAPTIARAGGVESTEPENALDSSEPSRSYRRRGATIASTVAEHARRGAAFLVIGGIAFLVDAATYNVLVFGGGHGPMFELPILAKVIAIVLASIATYLGNHWWTFRDRKNRPSVRQILVFALINGGAILLQLGCLGFSRYVLGFADPVADNISGTLIGQAFATIFRYFMYDRFVFPDEERGDAPETPAKA